MSRLIIAERIDANSMAFLPCLVIAWRSSNDPAGGSRKLYIAT